MASATARAACQSEPRPASPGAAAAAPSRRIAASARAALRTQAGAVA
eukprot:CAMPEP_0185417822 /NCGR_PEP_ID=MMETSP1365-20130426/8289_1 /TAXON_ID=38817 /ORGANISM="Gephyrocapsa oceanica, Strain RCC1303" /LENGTH=46 /DNA_ID= /DNA_START= /DNA_END= /DNA_ORIENTATION=